MNIYSDNVISRILSQRSNEVSQLSIIDNKLKLNEKMKKLENVSIKHEDTLGDIIINKNNSTEKILNKLPFVESNNWTWREYANDFSCLFRDFERRVRALEDSNNNKESSLFRDQIIADFDRHKRAISEDIINLNCKINDVETKLNDNLSKVNKKYVIKRAEHPSNRPTKWLKKVYFNSQAFWPTKQSKFQNGDSNDHQENSNTKFLNSSPESITMIRSNKNDNTFLQFNHENKEWVRNKRQCSMQSRTVERNLDRRVYNRDLTPVAELIPIDEYLSNCTIYQKKVASSRGKSAELLRANRDEDIHTQSLTRLKHMKNYSFDKNEDE